MLSPLLRFKANLLTTWPSSQSPWVMALTSGLGGQTVIAAVKLAAVVPQVAVAMKVAVPVLQAVPAVQLLHQVPMPIKLLIKQINWSFVFIKMLSSDLDDGIFLLSGSINYQYWRGINGSVILTWLPICPLSNVIWLTGMVGRSQVTIPLLSKFYPLQQSRS